MRYFLYLGPNWEHIYEAFPALAKLEREIGINIYNAPAQTSPRIAVAVESISIYCTPDPARALPIDSKKIQMFRKIAI